MGDTDNVRLGSQRTGRQPAPPMIIPQVQIADARTASRQGCGIYDQECRGSEEHMTATKPRCPIKLVAFLLRRHVSGTTNEPISDNPRNCMQP